MAYLLDTDWTIQYLNGLDRFVKRVDELETDGLSLSVVSIGELYEGVAGSSDPRSRESELNAFLERVDILSVDSDIARVFGLERLRLRRAGRMIGELDILIAATALRHGLTLLTNNRRHFDRIPNLALESI